MRVLVLLAVILLPACSTTPSTSAPGGHEPGVITSSNADFGRRNTQSTPYRCRTGYVLVCDAGEEEVRCRCENGQRYGFGRSQPRVNGSIQY